MKIGVQKLCNQLKKLDSGFRRNDKKCCFSTFYEFIKVQMTKSKCQIKSKTPMSKCFSFDVGRSMFIFKNNPER